MAKEEYFRKPEEDKTRYLNELNGKENTNLLTELARQEKLQKDKQDYIDLLE